MYFHLNILANTIINSYFTSSNCLLIFNGNFTQFEYTGNLPFVVLTVHDGIDEKVAFNSFGCQGIVIFSDTPRKIFENFETSIRNNLERFNFRRYLFLPTENSDNFDVFDSERLEFVSDLLVVGLLSSEDDVYQNILKTNHVVFGLYSQKYVGVGNESKIIVDIDHWFSKNRSFLRNENLFPDKLRNQMGRDLRIATFTYKPYAIPANRDGTEVFIALEFANRYNMTPKFIVDEAGQWGEVFDNWTGYGILGNLVTDKADVGLGALYTWEHEYHFLDIAKPSSRSGITCIAPAPKLVGGWITPFISFSWKIWVMVFVSFLICLLAIFGAVTFDTLTTDGNRREKDKLENLMTSFMLTQAIFLLQGLSKIPRNSHARIIFALTLSLSFLMASLYSSGLASNMTVPRYSGTIRNVQDLARSNLKWGATSLAWISALFDDDNFVYKTVVNNFLALSHEELAERNDQLFGFAVERLLGGHYAIGSYITNQGIQRRRLMDEDVDWEYSVMMLKKSSILLPKLDQLLLEVAQGGLIYIWEYEITVRAFDMKLQEAVRSSAHLTRPDKTKLTLSHVEGAFALWCVGIVVSTVAFICELFLYKKSMDK